MKLPRKRWIILIAVILVIAALVTYGVIHETPSVVQTDKAIKKTLVQKVSASGKVQPVEEVEISAYVSGQVTKLYVKEGEQVEAGQRLADLDSTRYRANQDQVLAALYSARASRKQAEAQMILSDGILKRTEELFTKNMVGKQELETAQARHKVDVAIHAAAKDGVSQAQAAYRLAKDDLAKTSLFAPIDGTVSRLNKEVGEMVMGSQFTRDIIMAVADLSKMEIVVEVDENDVVDIQLDDSVEVEVDAIPDTKFPGKVTSISTSAMIEGLGTQQETTNFEVTVLIDK